MVFKGEDEGREIKDLTDILSYLFPSDCPYDEDRPILVDAQAPENSLSWAQVKRLVRKLAAGFRAYGVKKGDCFCFLSFTNIYYYPIVYGLMAAGGIFYGAPTRWTVAECKMWASKIAGANYFLVDPTFINHAVETVDELGLDRSHIIVLDASSESISFDCDHGSFATWRSLLEHGEADWERVESREAAMTSIPMRLNTGGTSGAPKVAELSHYALIAHIFQWDHFFGTQGFDVRALHYVGLNGASGHGFISTAMRLGFPVYLLRYSLDGIIEACERLRPTLVMMDPDTGLRMAKMLPPESQALRSLRDIRCLGMDFPLEAQKKFKVILHPDCLISRPYGLTEGGTVAAMFYSQRERHDPGSVGFTWPGVQIKLLDDDGSEIVDYDRAGELVIKTPAMFTGYYNDPDATAAAFKDGWFSTGDVGYISLKTQQWYLIGRKSNIFQVNHQFVAPEELESLLVSHPDIDDAAVAPLPVSNQEDPKIRAYVTVRSPGVISEEDIVSFTQGKLASHKAITGGVAFVDKVPRNGLRKIVRWKLKEMNEVTTSNGNGLQSVHPEHTPDVQGVDSR